MHNETQGSNWRGVHEDSHSEVVLRAAIVFRDRDEKRAGSQFASPKNVLARIIDGQVRSLLEERIGDAVIVEAAAGAMHAAKWGSSSIRMAFS
jgi:hypothetical protein